MTEEELLKAIAKAEQDSKECKSKLHSLKKKTIEIESHLIETLVQKDRYVEELRKLKASDPTHVPDMRDIEIEDFRQRFPDLCQK
jgi:hypothetical protein